MSDRKLPLQAETLITTAAIKLIESRRNFKPRQVVEALDLLCATLVEYGSLTWPPLLFVSQPYAKAPHSDTPHEKPHE